MRVGVVGVGVMGSNHARVFAGLPGTELVGVADPDRKQAEFVARTLGCVAVADVGELCREPVRVRRGVRGGCAHGGGVLLDA